MESLFAKALYTPPAIGTWAPMYFFPVLVLANDPFKTLVRGRAILEGPSLEESFSLLLARFFPGMGSLKKRAHTLLPAHV